MASPLLLEGPGGIPGGKLRQGFSTKVPFTFLGPVTTGGITNGSGGTLASAATITLTPSARLVTHTPTQNETINFATTGFLPGVEVCIEVVTSGVTSFTLTFGSNTKSQGTLATGTVTAKTYLIKFVFDGTNWIEVSRTSAM